MEILFDKDGSSITGMLNKKDGYAIQRTKRGSKTRYYSARRVPYSIMRDTDPRHARFLLAVARMAVNTNNLVIKDIRVTVREVIDARVSLVSGVPLSQYCKDVQKRSLQIFTNTISLQLRKVKPSSVLNAKDIIKLHKFLGE